MNVRLLLFSILALVVVSLRASRSERYEKNGVENIGRLPLEQPRYVIGKDIWQTYCRKCHRLFTDWTGPALKNIEDRWEKREELKQFIINNEELRKSGHEYANAVFRSWNQSRMPNYPWLTDDWVESILLFIKVESEKGDE